KHRCFYFDDRIRPDKRFSSILSGSGMSPCRVHTWNDLRIKPTSHPPIKLGSQGKTFKINRSIYTHEVRWYKRTQEGIVNSFHRISVFTHYDTSLRIPLIIAYHKAGKLFSKNYERLSEVLFNLQSFIQLLHYIFCISEVETRIPFQAFGSNDISIDI